MSPANVTINDVARAAGVSKSLVSLTLNARPGVASETRERILQTARDLGWTPHPGARGLSTRRAYALGLVLRREPRTIEVDPFFASFIAGVETVLAERGNVLVLTVVPDRAAEERAYERLVADKRVDGFLLTDLLAADERIPLISRLGSYAVSLGEPPGGSPFPVITRDYDSGIDELVRHLVQLGHRRIAHVSGDERMLHGLRRRERFELAAAAAGISPVVVTTDFSPEQGAEATKALLETEDRPTAIVYGNDPMAIAGMGVAHERGLDLPAELSITGLDGSHIGSFVYPSLTTLDNDPAGWGTAAATALLRLVEDGEPGDVALPPARLVVRASTAPPSAG
ncbi:MULTISPECIES: LacI family DNA-binding transcriptional regulator [unclassified Leifsonia]|jgi:DNA-binding LacI/PurR family transcriptional regulator|uniref:LacI family DNA-binding transcriptional regulator n=1 Tax=unclassified Leifsonia TaxID=2663824 RepID=UPI0003676AA5|nr:MULTISPECIES: LacI family DNA-binding transcriptional regulator [unclassified Leifsonia]TDQ03369.1 LacI family transcriptional regulator [Leifsonia sp. 115AMFTsu3.1]